jgi:hypothetical protein
MLSCSWLPVKQQAEACALATHIPCHAPAVFLQHQQVELVQRAPVKATSAARTVYAVQSCSTLNAAWSPTCALSTSCAECRLQPWFTTRADENAADTGVTWPSPYITRLWKFFFKVLKC